MAVSGLLVLASSLMPWWTVRTRIATDSEVHYDTRDGSAWQMSSRWSEAVVITLAAVALWLVWRLARGTVPWPVWVVVVCAPMLSMVLVLQQRHDVEPWSTAGTRLSTSISISEYPTRYDPTDEIAKGWMVRDQLRSYHSDGLVVDVGWGLWVALGGMVLVSLSLAVAGLGYPFPPLGPGTAEDDGP